MNITKTKDYAIVIGKRDDGKTPFLSLYNKKLGKFEMYLGAFTFRDDFDCCAHGDKIIYEEIRTKIDPTQDSVFIKFVKNISHEKRIESFEKAYEKISPLYTKMENGSGRICRVTGNNCKIVTDYFQRLHDTMEQSTKDGRTFITKECNLCAENECPIWNKTIQQILEFSNQNSK